MKMESFSSSVLSYELDKQEMICVKVSYSNGDSIVTSINGNLEGAIKYFLGRWFNIGSGGNDLMAKAVKVELV